MDLGKNITKKFQDKKQLPAAEKTLYDKTEKKRTIDYRLYGARLEMLFLLKGIIKNKSEQIKHFRLASNMMDAGNFGDIVFKYDYGNVVKSKVIFLQAKHEENPIKSKISLHALLSQRHFSLKDSFKSFLEIKNKFCKNSNHTIFQNDFNDSEFIIYSNALANNYCRKPINIEETNVPKEDILSFTGDNYYYEFLNKNVFIDLRNFVQESAVCDYQLNKFRGNKETDNAISDSSKPNSSQQKVEERKVNVPEFLVKNKNFEKKIVPEKDILNFTSKNYYYQLKFGVNKETDEAILDALLGPTNRNPSQQEVDEVAEFLSKLKIYIQQPNKDQLGEILKQEIEMAYKVEENVARLFFLDIQNKLQKLAEESGIDSLYLTEDCTLFEETKQNLYKLMFDVLAIQSKEKIEKHELRFNTNQIEILQKSIRKNQICNIITNNITTLLSTAKVYQALQDMNEFCTERFNKYILISLSSLHRLWDKVISTFESEEANLLVIECESFKSPEEAEEKYKSQNIKGVKNLKEIVNKNNNKRIILITKRGDDRLKTLMATEINENINGLIDLTNDSQEILLKNFKVVFQGEEVNLKTVIGEESKSLINADALSKLINNEKIEIGKPLDGLGEVPDFYIKRTFCHHVKIKDECFKTINPRDIFVFSCTNSKELSKFIYGNNCRKYQEVVPNKENPIRFVLLDKNENKSFNQLCRDYESFNIHWLKKEGHAFIWQRTHGTLEHLRQFVDESSGIEYQEDKIFDTTDIDKVMILSAEAGMGKSTIITKLAQQSKSSNSSLWVIRINLNEHTDKLKQMNFNQDDDIIEFLLEITDLKTNLERELLKDRMKNAGKLVMYFDGFDEIRPDYEEKVVKILTFLKSTKVEKLWITTRPHTKYQLEDELGKLSYNLKPFSKDNQKQFLMKFWGKTLYLDLSMKDSRTNKYIEELLGVLKNSIADHEVKFTGIPLQTRMFAEIFQEDFDKYYCSVETETNLPKKLNLVNLYTDFIRKKSEVYGKDMQKEFFFKSFCERHEFLAMSIFFSKDEIENIFSEQERKNLEEAKRREEMTGIINGTVNGRPSFIHRTFAEFFAANRFVKQYKNREAAMVLNKILFERENEVFRYFFDRILADDDCDESDKYALHNAVLSKDEAKIKQLLSTRKDIINQPDKGGRTALHLAASYGDENIVGVLLKNGISVSRHDQIFTWTPLRYADRLNHWGVAELLLKHNANIEDMIGAIERSHEEVKSNLIYSLLHLAAEKGYLCFLKLLLKKNDINKKSEIVNIFDISNNTPLHLAAKCGETEVVKYLIELNAGIDNTNVFGETPSFVAAKMGKIDILKLLIEKNADLSRPDNGGVTLFHVAVEFGDIKLLKYLIEKNGDFIGKADNKGRTSVHYAAKKCGTEIMKLLIKKGADLNVIDKKGRTPFHEAIEGGKIELVEYLRKQNPNFVNIADNEDRTPLHFAVENDQLEILKLLVKKGATINAKNKSGLTPFHVAIKEGKIEIFKYLIEQNANFFRMPDYKYRTPLHFAVENGEFEILKLLIERGANLNVQDEFGLTPFHVAIKGGQIEIVKYLIEENAFCNHIADRNDQTPVHFAVENGQLEILKLLVKWGATLNAKNKSGLTPFHVAIQGGQIEIVKYLIEENPNFIHIADYKGRTPLHFAAENGELEILNLLIQKGGDLHVCDKDGITPLQLANKRCGTEYINKMVQSKCNK